MTFNFKKSAMANVTISPLMVDRDKITTAELIRDYPDGITVTAFDIVVGMENGDYPVINFAEDDSKFYASGGVVLKKIVNGWLEEFDGNNERGSQELANQGGVKMRFSERKSTKKNGYTYVAVEIL